MLEFNRCLLYFVIYYLRKNSWLGPELEPRTIQSSRAKTSGPIFPFISRLVMIFPHIHNSIGLLMKDYVGGLLFFINHYWHNLLNEIKLLTLN